MQVVIIIIGIAAFVMLVYYVRILMRGDKQ